MGDQHTPGWQYGCCHRGSFKHLGMHGAATSVAPRPQLFHRLCTGDVAAGSRKNMSMTIGTVKCQLGLICPLVCTHAGHAHADAAIPHCIALTSLLRHPPCLPPPLAPPPLPQQNINVQHACTLCFATGQPHPQAAPWQHQCSWVRLHR